MNKNLFFRVCFLASAMLGVAGAPGCIDPEDECAVGSEGCLCTYGGGCDPYLTCVSDLCVDLTGLPGGDTDTDTDADPVGPTWTDPVSGLIWQDPPSSESMVWEDAAAYCDDLSLGGGADWRLPTVSELRSLIRGCDATVTGGPCAVAEDCLDYASCFNEPCGGCGNLAGPGWGGAYWAEVLYGETGWYWSSSLVAGNADGAWIVDFSLGDLYTGYVDGYDYGYVRCVR